MKSQPVEPKPQAPPGPAQSSGQTQLPLDSTRRPDPTRRSDSAVPSVDPAPPPAEAVARENWRGRLGLTLSVVGLGLAVIVVAGYTFVPWRYLIEVAVIGLGAGLAGARISRTGVKAVEAGRATNRRMASAGVFFGHVAVGIVILAAVILGLLILLLLLSLS